MNEVSFWLDAAKNNLGLEQDKELAILLGTSPAQVAQYRKGSRSPAIEVCADIANLADANLADVWLSAEAARAKTPDARRLIEEIARKLGSVTTAIMAIVAVGISTVPATAYAQAAIEHGSHYAQRKRRNDAVARP